MYIAVVGLFINLILQTKTINPPTLGHDYEIYGCVTLLSLFALRRIL